MIYYQIILMDVGLHLIFTIMNNVQIYLQFGSLLGEIVDQRVWPFCFKRYCQITLQKLVPVYCPTNSFCECPFPHILTNTGHYCLKKSFHLDEAQHLFISLLPIYVFLWTIYSYPLPICYHRILIVSELHRKRGILLYLFYIIPYYITMNLTSFFYWYTVLF